MTKLTPTQVAALDYIGRHRKTEPKVRRGKLSRRTLNRLKQLGLVMEYGKLIMLTAQGERYFTKMHPYSKYRIS